MKPPKKNGDAMTKAEKSHLSKVAALGCLICGTHPAAVHHIRRYGAKRDHLNVLPLCHFHHQGAEGVHHLGSKAWQEKYGRYEDLQAKLQQIMEVSP